MNRKPGDWNCRSCQHLNFSRRDSCQRCGDMRSGDRNEYSSFGGARGGSSFGFGGSDVRPGDWYCPCGYRNFASRSNCHKCGTFKDESAAAGGGGGGFDGGDVSRPRGYGFGSSGGGTAATAASGGGRAGWKSGDWICTRSGCNEHNFASRMECFRCNAPRDSGTEV
uniref:Putative RNA-binding protein C17H9.04c n=1 Tax=Anthurium amnicola TaxID=1678845 RepID=A0A1D1Z1S6_9ARAE